MRPGGFVLELAESLDAGSVGIVGSSGSGKSTLMDAIGGFEPTTRLTLDGADLSRLPSEARGIGYVGQDAILFPHLTVRANLLYSPRARELGDIPAALGIGHLLDRMPRNLSGGERRRAALARAIVSRPRLLLLDEPFTGLDERLRREAMAHLHEVRRRYAIPMLLVSHVADEIVGLTDWLLRLEAGRVVGRGPTLELLRGGENRIDNYLTGTVVGTDRVCVGGVELAAPLPEGATGSVRLSCYAHDVMLAMAAPEAVSARNLLRTRVASLDETAGGTLVSLEEPRLKAILTPTAVASLRLAPDVEVFAIIKATAITYLGPA